jgi:putative hydrolase of the HAD superfamily
VIKKLLLQGVCAVVFDAVGTVIHPQPPAPLLYAEVGRRFGSKRTAEEIKRRFIAAFAQEETIDYAHGLRTSEAREVERWRRIVRHVFDDLADTDACFRELFEHFSRPEAWRCAAEVTETAEALTRHGYALGLASNYDQRLRSVVAGFGVLSSLPHVIISSEVGWRKPAPQFFAALCQAFGLPAEQILYIGDDPANDYEGAQAAGLRAVLFDPKDKDVEAARVRIRTLPELRAELSEIP